MEEPKKKEFPRGWQECKKYMEAGHSIKASDDTEYVRTPNGNLVRRDKFIKKYAGPIGG